MDVIVTDQFIDWYKAQSERTLDDIGFVVGLLEQKGVHLGHPYSSAIKESKIALRELRISSEGQPVRIFYVFDPARDAVLLIGGIKSGISQKLFYKQMIATAESIWKEYLDENF